MQKIRKLVDLILSGFVGRRFYHHLFTFPCYFCLVHLYLTIFLLPPLIRELC
jgi:hypothetical protein